MSLRQELSLRWRRDVSENLWMALDTLRAHKLRSGLTVLGIIIAVVTVVAVFAILLGFDRNVKEAIQSFGTNTAFFSHLPSGPRIGRMTKEERTRKPLSYEDYLVVKEACTACVSTTVSVFTRNEFHRLRYKGEEIVGFDFRGATEEFFSVYANAVVKHGRPFTGGENQHRAEVVVIGEDAAKGLFAAEDPLDKEVFVDGRGLRVIGVFEKPRGAFGGPGGEGDRRVVVPYWTFRKLFAPGEEAVHGIRIEAYPGRLPLAIDETRTALRRSRRLAFSQRDNFDYSTSDSIIEQFHQIVGIVALVTAVIASVGLMIGGVGVMNIMLVSVTERTREIGVRKAIGARRRDIVWQFLSEAMALTGSAGVVGVVIAYALTALVVQRLLDLPGFIPVWVIVLAVGVASSVGLFFGMYPAVKAARLDPVDALRYE